MDTLSKYLKNGQPVKYFLELNYIIKKILIYASVAASPLLDNWVNCKENLEINK